MYTHLYITEALLRSGTDASAENKINLINLDIRIPTNYWGVIPLLAVPPSGTTPRDLLSVFLLVVILILRTGPRWMLLLSTWIKN
mgnify:CR=1 FL=1